MIDFWHVVRTMFYLAFGMALLLAGTLLVNLNLTNSDGYAELVFFGLFLAVAGLFRMIRSWKDSKQASRWNELSPKERNWLLQPIWGIFEGSLLIYLIWQLNTSPAFAEDFLVWIKNPIWTPTLKVLIGVNLVLAAICIYLEQRKPKAVESEYDQSEQ